MIGYLTRLKLIAYSGLAGWVAGFLVVSPLELLIGLRDSQGEPRLFTQTLMMGLAVWGVWTLVLAFAAWLMIAGPCVLIFQPAMLIRFRSRVLLLTALLSVVASFVKLIPFRDQATSKVILRFELFFQYGSFALSFAVVTAWLYLRLARRSLLSS
jgi:hypothetical protein